jgi:uncharacterized protein YneF (UPF0154 family)
VVVVVVVFVVVCFKLFWVVGWVVAIYQIIKRLQNNNRLYLTLMGNAEL